MRRSKLVCLWLVLGGCGQITAPGTDSGMPPEDAKPGVDACVDALQVSAQFTINQINGNNEPSTLDRLLNHPNGFILSFNDYSTLKAAESSFPGGPISFLTAIKSSSWKMDYTGQDGDFLDTEVGAHLTVGLAVQDSIFQLGSDGQVYLYVLPQDTSMHPYMELRCNGITFQQDVGGYPILASFTAQGCSIVFFDFRPPTQRNEIASQNVTFELTANQCASP